MLLVSDEASDSDVLLVSFELEQMLEDMDPRAHSPKVCVALKPSFLPNDSLLALLACSLACSFACNV